MSSALQTCADRITVALEYLTNEPDRERGIYLAKVQLQHAQVSLATGRGAVPCRRETEAPLETAEGQARSFTEVRGRMVVAECEALLENLP